MMKMITRRLLVQLVVSIVVMALVMGGLIFGTAGTWHFWQAWAALAAFFVPTLLVTADLLRHQPDLLTRRLQWREPERQQQVGQLLLNFCFLAIFVVAGLDHRFGWSAVPVVVVIGADVAVIVGFYFVWRVFRANPYAASVVQVESAQQIIDTGPYAVVRHPMYLGALPLILGLPLAFASYWALLAVVPMIIGILIRIHTEERLLRRNLTGYEDYCQRVRWRLVPGVW